MLTPHNCSSHRSAIPFALVISASILLLAIWSISTIPAGAQGNGTALLDEIGTSVNTNREGISRLSNMTMAEMAILNDISLTSTKLATQSAYTAMSVFFLGIGLVIFGLRLTGRAVAHMGKYFTIMIWALTVPVIVLIVAFQLNAVLGVSTILAESDEPFFLLSFLMYIPIAIVVFLLLAQKKMIHQQPAKAPDPIEHDPIRRIEMASALMEKGMITEEEFKSLKSGILNKRQAEAS